MKLIVKKPKKKKVEGYRHTTHLELPEIRRPTFTAKLFFPEDITELASHNISDLLGKYTLLASYVQQDLARLNRGFISCETGEKLRKVEILQERPQINTLEKWKRDAFFESDRRMSLFFEKRQSYQMQRESSLAFLAIYDRYITALSRELTRKTTEESQLRYTKA